VHYVLERLKGRVKEKEEEDSLIFFFSLIKRIKDQAQHSRERENAVYSSSGMGYKEII
jgi:hypothetical protein